MTVKLRRPILVGGIGLSLLLWLLDTVQNSMAELGEVSILGIMAAGVGLWLFKKPQSTPSQNQTLIAPPPTKEAAEQAIALSSTTIDKLLKETKNSKTQAKVNISISQLQQQLKTLTDELQRQKLTVAVTGSHGVGKTSLAKILKTQWVSPSDEIEINDISWCRESKIVQENNEINALSTYDLILFITTGDLIDSEYQALSKLTSLGQRFLLVWNKQDQYLPDQKPQILQKLKETLSNINSAEDVVGTAVNPNSVKVKKYQPDGSIEEFIEQPLPEISGLIERLNKILVDESQQLVWATTKRKAEIVTLEAKSLLHKVRREVAIPVIEQYQWIAAATAFANPVPALDLLATAAINAQLIVDLSEIYEQKFSLEQGKQVAGRIAELMVKLGLVELSTKALTTILKSNSVTFVAGGVVQAVSVAYLTRVAGMSLIEYFPTQTDSNSVNVEKLGKILQRVFRQTQENNFLKSFVSQVTSHILPQGKKVESLQN
ncbi:MAG: DUF697 domain-containing protein [Microcoleaceae cyanobacterium MO_207.B10]|nr:DUF697 domain-containing protein [Microcoleaceae cyanobacterium MO_207.B10]